MAPIVAWPTSKFESVVLQRMGAFSFNRFYAKPNDVGTVFQLLDAGAYLLEVEFSSVGVTRYLPSWTRCF